MNSVFSEACPHRDHWRHAVQIEQVGTVFRNLSVDSKPVFSCLPIPRWFAGFHMAPWPGPGRDTGCRP